MREVCGEVGYKEERESSGKKKRIACVAEFSSFSP
jgi:hypothetical protein